MRHLRDLNLFCTISLKNTEKVPHSAFSVNNLDKYIMYFTFSKREKLGLSSPWQSPYVSVSLFKEHKKARMSQTLKTYYMKVAFKPEYFICFEHGIWMKRDRIEKKLNKKERQHKIFQRQTSTQKHNRCQITIYKRRDSLYFAVCSSKISSAMVWF